MAYDVYTLILKHEIFDTETDERFQVDEPLVLRQMWDIRNGHSSYFLHEMMEKMKMELLNRYKREN